MQLIIFEVPEQNIQKTNELIKIKILIIFFKRYFSVKSFMTVSTIKIKEKIILKIDV